MAPGRVGVGRAAVRRVVLEPAVPRRVVRRRDDDAVRGVALVRVGVVHHDRPGHRRGGGVVLVALAAHRHVVGQQHLDGRRPRGLGQRMGVLAQVERTGDPLRRPVLHDRLRGGRDVQVVERGVQAGAAVTRGAEHHLLVRVGRIGRQVVVRADDRVDVDQVFGGGRLAGARVSHGSHSADTGERREGGGRGGHPGRASGRRDRGLPCGRRANTIHSVCERGSKEEASATNWARAGTT